MPGTRPDIQSKLQQPQVGAIDCFLHTVESKGVDLPLVYAYGTAERDAIRELFLGHIPGTYDLSGADDFYEEACHELWLDGRLIGILLVDLRSLEEQDTSKTTLLVSVVCRGLYLSEPYRDVGIGTAFMARAQTHCRPSLLGKLIAMHQAQQTELEVEVGTYLVSDMGDALSTAAAKELSNWLECVRLAYKLPSVKVVAL